MLEKDIIERENNRMVKRKKNLKDEEDVEKRRGEGIDESCTNLEKVNKVRRKDLGAIVIQDKRAIGELNILQTYLQ